MRALGVPGALREYPEGGVVMLERHAMGKIFCEKDTEGKPCPGVLLPITRLCTEFKPGYNGGVGWTEVMGTIEMWKCTLCGKEVK
jgi:hypothetical protein